MTRCPCITVLTFLTLFGAPAALAEAPQPAEVRRAVDVEQVLLDLDGAPEVERVQRWAIGEAMVSPERATRLLRDARTRGALPLVRLRGRYKDSTGKKWDELDLLDSRDRDSDYTVDLWLEWDLAELAASADTWRAAREARALAELRQGVLTQVTIAYFDRKRLVAEGLLAPPQEAVERAIVRRLRVQELDATLDALTGGRWTDALRQASPTRTMPRASRTGSSPTPAESARDRQGEDPHPGLRVPVHAADRPTRP